MPEMPEIQAHAERLTERFAGRTLTTFTPFNFTALKTAVPAPDTAYDLPLLEVGRRGKYLLVCFEPTIFVVHLMQGGRLLADEKLSAKPRGGQARFTFAPVERTEPATMRSRRHHWRTSAPRPRRSPTTNSPPCSLPTPCAYTASCAIRE